jgi:two-component system, LuxR family, sensor kinase FixL
MGEAAKPQPNLRPGPALYFYAALVVALGAGAVAMGVALVTRYGVMVGNRIDVVLLVALGATIAVSSGLMLRAHSLAAGKRRNALELQGNVQSILDTVPDPMLVTDEEGRILAFSRAAETLLKWTKEEVLGRNVAVLMPSDDREARDSDVRRFGVSSEGAIISPVRIVTAQRRDGSSVSVELSVGEAFWNGRRFLALVMRDLSERQAAETRLRTVQAELVHISRLSAMGEMATGLAHELNQPLTAISNFLKGGQRLLELENPQSRALAAMGRAADESLRAGDIIRRLRDFVARGDSDRCVESLRKLSEEAIALALMGARERGVVARVRWTAAADAVLVDKIQVQQVVLNLVRNAIEAMEDSNVRELNLSTSQGEHGMALVSVSDTGAGISPGIASQLFKPFVTTKGSQGMGVGLSICRTIIESHGGRIWAEPNPAGGTVFRFTLPRAVLEEAA